MSRPQTAAAVPRTVDAYRVTGTSPGASAGAIAIAQPPRAIPVPLDRPVSRRTRDAVHVLGAGAVGCALLQRFRRDRRRVIAVTDSTATLHDASGIDIDTVLDWKRAGRSLSDHPHALTISGPAAIERVDADIIADASSTDLERSGWTNALTAALARGACVAAAAKAALCDAGAEWLTGDYLAQVGCNAVLGGTGRSFIAELPDLRQRTQTLAIVGNASTTTILEVIEQGGTLDQGLAEAQRAGYLEPDPALDLCGADAAVKLAIVAGIVTGRRIDPRTIPCDDLRLLDPLLIRARVRRNATTRLVGRMGDAGRLRVSYEEISRDSILAAPRGRVIYEYRLARDERRLHIGTGLGADATAGALWTDIRALAGAAQTAVSR
ncbi:MAG TPA: hypothetical protein VK912_20315 [Longimicrobiales bacterium]|nr:hypothetical protein [Longimicrobiales bacterium]